MGAIWEGNIPARHLRFEHDIGMNFRCGAAYVLSLEEATGASVQGALPVNGNCNVAGQLVVNGVNVLNELTQNAAASMAATGIDAVTGLTAALAAKQAILGSTSTLQLSELACSRLKPASQTLSLADSGGVERLGISASSAVFSCAVSAPSLDVGGSVVLGSSLLLAGPLYLNGQDITALIAANAVSSLGASTQLSVASYRARETFRHAM